MASMTNFYTSIVYFGSSAYSYRFLRYITIQKYRNSNGEVKWMLIRELEVILYCGQPSTASGDVCQEDVEAEDDCALLDNAEGREWCCT